MIFRSSSVWRYARIGDDTPSYSTETEKWYPPWIISKLAYALFEPAQHALSN